MCSPDGASTDRGGEHLIAAYYLFIDPERMIGWADLQRTQFTHISGHPSAESLECNKESSPAEDLHSTTVPPHQLLLYVAPLPLYNNVHVTVNMSTISSLQYQLKTCLCMLNCQPSKLTLLARNHEASPACEKSNSYNVQRFASSDTSNKIRMDCSEWYHLFNVAA